MNKFLTLPILLFHVFATFAQLTNETISINGVNRSYKLYVPSGFNAQTESPDMIIIMHGLGGTNSDMVPMGFNLIADTARVIVVYPQGLPNSWGQNAWNNGTLLSNTADDLGFMHALINRGEMEFNVNPARVYATGFSMGSIMSHHLACHMNQRIAAIGGMAGTMATSNIQNCNPEYKTPVIHLHGTIDGTVPYNSNPLPSLSLVPETMAFWRTVHGCAATADSSRLADVVNDNITVDRFVYDGCNPTASVELYRFNGADHQYLYQPVNDITEIIHVWRFLRQWSHTDPSTLSTSDLESVGLRLYPNPATNGLRIQVSESSAYQILDLTGKVVSMGTLMQGEQTIDISNYQSGVYFFKLGDEQYKFIKQ